MFRRPRRGVVVGACLALACGGAADAPPADDQSSPPVGTAAAPEARPLTLDAISPGDTAAVLDLMQDLMADGERRLEGAERRDTTLAPVAGTPARTLSLWTREDRVLKLSATEPNDQGQMLLETNAWFRDGELTVVQAPFAILLFDRGRLMMWADEGLIPVEASLEEMQAEERVVVDSVRARLATFGVRYP
ncbi:MAG: hypothetical protein KC544_11785 [Gemmatimonadetes bacterium]|nr:hypothetical protein [Gemmatimonadota bacterium]